MSEEPIEDRLWDEYSAACDRVRELSALNDALKAENERLKDENKTLMEEREEIREAAGTIDCEEWIKKILYRGDKQRKQFVVDARNSEEPKV